MIKISSKTPPSAKIAFYLDQAAKCGEMAATATLQNVRDRSLRSEAAWREMAGVIETADTAGSEAVTSGVVSSSTPPFASFA